MWSQMWPEVLTAELLQAESRQEPGRLGEPEEARGQPAFLTQKELPDAAMGLRQ